MVAESRIWFQGEAFVLFKLEINYKHACVRGNDLVEKDGLVARERTL